MPSRVLFVLPLAVLTAASLAACGSSGTSGSTTTSHPAPSPKMSSSHSKPAGMSSTSSAASPAPSSTAATNGSAHGVGLVLTTSELPSGSGSWHLERQGALSSSTPNSGQRVWSSGAHTALEVDVIGTSSAAVAKAAYPTWKARAGTSALSHIKTLACSKGAPPDCALKTGVTSDGKHEVVLSFQHLSALIAVVMATTGSVDTNLVQQIGYAELKHLDAVAAGTPAASSSGSGGFAVPVTDAAAAARALADQAKTGQINNGALTAWQNDGMALNGSAIPATPTSISGAVYFVTSKIKNVDYLAFAVKDTKGDCAGGVLEANDKTTMVAKTAVYPTVSGSCTGDTVAQHAGY